MNLKQRLQQIKQLEAVDTPWHVKRIFGQVQLYGSQFSMYNQQDSDFVDLVEAQEALEWLVEQLGGKIVWEKENKKEQKK